MKTAQCHSCNNQPAKEFQTLPQLSILTKRPQRPQRYHAPIPKPLSLRLVAAMLIGALLTSALLHQLSAMYVIG